jgi:hypothetical protein
MRALGASRTSAAPGGVLAGNWARDPLWKNARAVPSLDLRFAENKSLTDAKTGASLITFTRASTGTYVGSDGLLQSATTNEARFDHNPTTGESLGLLVEEARTNSIRNNTMVGAVAGTPGTLPTNWIGATTVDGLTREIVGIGTQNGINYIDIKVSGTSGTAGSTVLVTFDSVTQAIALTGQTWTPSFYLSIVNGSATNISTLTIRHRYYSAVGTPLTSLDTSVLANLSSVLQRFNGTANTATDALTAYTMFLLNVDFINSSPVDITLRIGLPQLEQGAFATSPILTSTATATRAADVASITGTNFSSFYNQTEGTVFSEYFPSAVAPATTSQTLIYISNNTSTDRNNINKRANADQTTRWASAKTGATDTAFINAGTWLAANTKIAAVYKNNDYAASLNGAASVVDTAVDLFTGMTQANIGSNQANLESLNGTIKRLTYWPVRLANPTLQSITSP